MKTSLRFDRQSRFLPDLFRSSRGQPLTELICDRRIHQAQELGSVSFRQIRVPALPVKPVPIVGQTGPNGVARGWSECREDGVVLRRHRAIVMGDPRLLVQALDSLVDNSLKYAAGTKVILDASLADPETVVIRVSDGGPGIPKGERGSVFKRFVRGKIGRRAARGSGLGLSIVKAIVESHGGTVELEATDGAGCTFLLHLPAALPQTAGRADPGLSVSGE